MELWTAVEVHQVQFSTDGIITEIEHTKAAQRRPEILRRKGSDLEKFYTTTDVNMYLLHFFSFFFYS